VDHFSTLFSSSNPILDDSLYDLVSPVIVDDNVALCSIPEKVEIFLVITELDLNKKFWS